MSALVPTVITYPEPVELSTGQKLRAPQLEPLADLINFAIGELGAEALVDQGFNSGHGEVHSTGTARRCVWSVPTLTELHTEVVIMVEAESASGTGTVSFLSALAAASVNISIPAAAGRFWFSDVLTVDPTGTYEEIEMYVAAAAGDLTVYAVRIEYAALSSPLPAAVIEIESGEASPARLIPIPVGAAVGGSPLLDDDQPMSAGAGRLLKRDLDALLTRIKRVSLNRSAWGDATDYLKCPANAKPARSPLQLARTWPGLEQSGLTHTVRARVIPDTAAVTNLKILIADDQNPWRFRTLADISIPADATSTPVWVTEEVQLPDGLYAPGRHLPSVRIGAIESYAIANTAAWFVSTCGIQTIAIWGRV